MSKHLLVFFATFAVGAVASLATRAAWFRPYVAQSSPAAAPEYAPMVTNPATPAADPHANHAPAPRAQPESESATVVNTVCAVCGMNVDPAVKPASYHGKLVGFGCTVCPPKFAADPDHFGPAALENRVASN